MKFTRRLLGQKNQKGVALLIAIFTMVFIFYLVTEILYESNVEYVVHAQSVNRLKAYYAAKSGLQLSLLRIKVYQQVSKQFGSKAQGPQKKLLDMIWSMPFAWPPVVPDDVDSVDKSMIKEKVKEAKMDATYLTTISDEGSKIDVNDLNSPSKGMREATRALLTQIYQNKIQNDEAWAAKHRDIKFDEIINSITDWETDTPTSLNGGSKQSLYAKFNDPNMPPNRAFRTIDEVRMVVGMTDDIWDLLKDRITVYGMHAINPNYATKEVLMALDASIKSEVADAIITRRNDDNQGGFFASSQDFWEFVNQKGGNVTPDAQKQIPLVFDAVYNFRIRSVGDFGSSTREITAVTFDLQSMASKIASQIQADAAGTTTGGKSSPTSTDPLPKGPPRIVYYNEK
jgi:general secretion pathway protein K